MAQRTVLENPGSVGEAPEFPGCRPIAITREEIETYEGRIEFWDADTEIAWMVREPNGAAHEQPSQRLAGLGQLIAAVRGSPIECFGTMDLLLRNERGEKRRIMQADQSVYLRPGCDRLPDPAGMVVGEHDFPDVVVEVDHTTDVRRGKLRLYEEWGFPEIWVEVPDRYSPSRPSGRLPGLTIHLLDEGRYRTDTESRAFTADEIHTAMNEPELSAATSEVLTRVGRTLGERDGTGPDDMPWLRVQREEGRAMGWAQGQAQGRVALLEALMQKILASRGKPGFGHRLDARDLAGVTDEEVIDALLGSKDESDFTAGPPTTARVAGGGDAAACPPAGAGPLSRRLPTGGALVDPPAASLPVQREGLRRPSRRHPRLGPDGQRRAPGRAQLQVPPPKRHRRRGGR